MTFTSIDHTDRTPIKAHGLTIEFLDQDLITATLDADPDGTDPSYDVSYVNGDVFHSITNPATGAGVMIHAREDKLLGWGTFVSDES